jgi:hypothetical protein
LVWQGRGANSISIFRCTKELIFQEKREEGKEKTEKQKTEKQKTEKRRKQNRRKQRKEKTEGKERRERGNEHYHTWARNAGSESEFQMARVYSLARTVMKKREKERREEKRGERKREEKREKERKKRGGREGK